MSAARQAVNRPPKAKWRWPDTVSSALLLFALVRFSISDGWDLFCTAPALFGAAGLIAGALRERRGLFQQLGTRGARYGRLTAAGSLMIFGLLAVANLIAARNNRTFDLTESGLFTLAPQTQQTLRSLTREVRLLAFFPPGRRSQAADLLRRYAEQSPRLKYEMIDPDQEPDRARNVGVTAYGTVVVEALDPEGKRIGSGKPVLVEPEAGQGRGLLIPEEKLTNALLKVTRGGAKSIYFLNGHGEADINRPLRDGYSRVRAALEGQAFTVKQLTLARDRKIPEDCAILVIAGPAMEPVTAETQAIQSYLQAGGKALILVDPTPGAGLEKPLDRWGVKVGKDFVVDTSGAGRAFGAGPAMPLVQDYDSRHPITQGFRKMTFFPLSRSLSPKQEPGDAQVWPLAQTTAESFAQPYSGSDRRLKFNAKTDRKGPLLLAVAVTRPAKEEKEARLVVIGSSNAFTNAFFDQAGNGDFLLNCVNWLAQEEELIALRPRPRQDRRVQLTEAEMRGVFWLVVVGLPLAALAMGIFVYWKRRG